MYPYIELFWYQISMMFIGTIIALIVFWVTAWILTKKNHQDFLKLFYWFPVWIILSYVLWRYVAFVLENGNIFPSSFNELLIILSPQNFNFHFVWLLIASWVCLWGFFSSVKRTENKKIWADIFFLSISNALIIFWIFLTLWDSVIWQPTNSIFAIRALVDNSNLTKFDSVYPVGLVLSFWVLIIHVLVSLSSIIFKKNGIWMWWLLWLLVVFNLCFLIQSYPRYWIISLFWTSFDVKQYMSLIVAIHCIITAIKWDKKRFY